MNIADEDARSNHSIWSRCLYMLLFAFFLWVAKFVVGAVVVVQFFFVLFTGAANDRLLVLGQSLSTYHYQVWRFLTFNSEQHPYPIGDWPEGEPVVPESKD